MIDGCIVLRVGVGAKRLGNQTADKVIFGLAVLAEGYTGIPFVVGKGRQQLCFSPFQALYPPQAAYKIFAFVALNLPPFFSGQVFYVIHFAFSFLSYSGPPREQAHEIGNK